MKCCARNKEYHVASSHCVAAASWSNHSNQCYSAFLWRHLVLATSNSVALNSNQTRHRLMTLKNDRKSLGNLFPLWPQKLASFSKKIRKIIFLRSDIGWFLVYLHAFFGVACTNQQVEAAYCLCTITTYHSLIPWKNCVLLSAAWIFMLWIFLFPSLLLQMNKFWKLTRSPREVRLLPLTVVEMGEQPGDSTVGRGRMAEMTRARQFGMATWKDNEETSSSQAFTFASYHINYYYVSQ